MAPLIAMGGRSPWVESHANEGALAHAGAAHTGAVIPPTVRRAPGDPAPGDPAFVNPAHGSTGPDEDALILCEVVGTTVGGHSLAELVAKAEGLLAGKLRRHGDWTETPRFDVCEQTGRLRVRIDAWTTRSEVLAGALYSAGARWVTVRGYPSAAALAAWSDFGKQEFVLPPNVVVEGTGGIGPRPRLAVPLIAASTIGLCLHGMGAIGWLGTLLLTGLISVVVLSLWHASRRSRIEWVRFDSTGEVPNAAAEASSELDPEPLAATDA